MNSIEIVTHEEDCPCSICEQARIDEIQTAGIESNEEGEK